MIHLKDRFVIVRRIRDVRYIAGGVMFATYEAALAEIEDDDSKARIVTLETYIESIGGC